MYALKTGYSTVVTGGKIVKVQKFFVPSLVKFFFMIRFSTKWVSCMRPRNAVKEMIPYAKVDFDP